jgi:hypothetical protein
MLDARRNFAGDTDGTDHFWVAGGYDGSGAVVAAMQNFNCPVSPCASPTPTPTPTVTPSPTPSGIVLRAHGKRVEPNAKLVKLRWMGATSPSVNIYRNEVRIARVPANPGVYTDTLFSSGFFTYQVCEAGTRNCSNEVTVSGP